MPKIPSAHKPYSTTWSYNTARHWGTALSIDYYLSFFLWWCHISTLSISFRDATLWNKNMCACQDICASITPRYCVKVSAIETIILFSMTLCPVESLWSVVSLWKRNFILHSWQIHIAFRSSGCIIWSHRRFVVNYCIYKIIKYLNGLCYSYWLLI